MIKYAWSAAKLIEKKNIFLNVNSVCFAVTLLKNYCACQDLSSIKYILCVVSLSRAPITNIIQIQKVCKRSFVESDIIDDS